MAKKCSGNPYMRGKVVEPLDIKVDNTVEDFIENVFGASGYNARRLAEACDIYRRMIKNKATVALTLAGAMTPIGMSGPIIELMKRGFVDIIISTGANIYHDLHRAYDFPVVQGSPNVDDADLNKHGVARIYDTFIHDEETLMSTDAVILDAVFGMDCKGPMSTARFHRILGESVLARAPRPDKSFLAHAARLGVPVYTSSPGDSSIAMNMVVPYLRGKRVNLDPVLDVIETTAIVREGGKNGVVIVGGGSPKNFYLQTQPTLWQILKDDMGGHDYFIQLTTDSPHWGGLSGATPHEAKSWGKVKDASANHAVVYSCASITFPLLCKYLIETVEPALPKELLFHLDEKVGNLKKRALSNPELNEDFKKHAASRKKMKTKKK
jgi:deoxyhypusine synthase